MEIHSDRIDDKERNFFKKNNYIIIKKLLSNEMLNEIKKSVINYENNNSIIKVRWKDSTFDTFNGSDIDINFPEISKIYEEDIKEIVKYIFNKNLKITKDRSVGLSINLINKNGKFQPHFDRNIATAVLYINDDYEGGEMVFYPRLRFWLGHPSNKFKKIIQRVLDKMVRSQWYIKNISKRLLIKPESGDLFIFEGTRTYHCVMPVIDGATRISIQFAYDLPDIIYDVKDYYGKNNI